MDTLTAVLRQLRLRATVVLHADFCGRWAVDTSGAHKATFHVVSHGHCWAHFGNGEPPLALETGDFLLLPHDCPHLLSPLPWPPDINVPHNQPAAVAGSNGATGLVCGYLEFDTPAWNPVIQALPGVVVLRHAERALEPAIDALLTVMLHEARGGQTGGDALLDRLGDALFILAVRAVMRERPGTGFLAALADPKLARALDALHAEPAAPWTLAALGRISGMSRAVFARRFLQATGMTPLAYLTHWRIQLSRGWLQEPGLSMLDIAERAGYASEAAFGRAFKRETGHSPGACRRRVP